jgi:ABC-type oligopeptide transport system substrate-binding subunit
VFPSPQRGSLSFLVVLAVSITACAGGSGTQGRALSQAQPQTAGRTLVIASHVEPTALSPRPPTTSGITPKAVLDLRVRKAILFATDRAERSRAAADAFKVASDELPVLPLYYLSVAAAHTSALTGMTGGSSSDTAWDDIHTWRWVK